MGNYGDDVKAALRLVQLESVHPPRRNSIRRRMAGLDNYRANRGPDGKRVWTRRLDHKMHAITLEHMEWQAKAAKAKWGDRVVIDLDEPRLTLWEMIKNKKCKPTKRVRFAPGTIFHDDADTDDESSEMTSS